MITIKLKDIGYAVSIAVFVLSISISLVINNSLPMLAVAFPLILLNRAFIIPLLIIIPAIEGAFKVEDTASITETVAIAGLLPIFVYDLLKRNKVVVPMKLVLLYVGFAFFVIIGLVVYLQHPEIYTALTKKGLDGVYMKVLMKVVKIIFFFVYLKVLINYDKAFIKSALVLFRNIIPFLIIVMAVFLATTGRPTDKFGTLHFGDAHHGDFTANVCALGVYLYIGLFERRQSLLFRVIIIIALVGMLYIVMQMASRNGLLSFAFISMISGYLVLKNRTMDMKVIMVIVGIFVAAAALYKFQDSPTIERSIYETEEKSGGDRLSYWSAGIRAIQEEPFVGLGGDESSSLYAVGKYSPEVEDHVMHNTFLECTVEYGLFGLAFFLVLVLTILRWSYKNLKYALATDDLILAAPGISYLISIFAGLFISRIWEKV
jgi:hypothetical protein